MDLKKFEEIENKTMQIIKRVGVVKADWLAKELNISIEEASEALEALRHRGDLARDQRTGNYHKRKA